MIDGVNRVFDLNLAVDFSQGIMPDYHKPNYIYLDEKSANLYFVLEFENKKYQIKIDERLLNTA